MKPRFSFSFRETRFLFLETPSILNMFFFRFFRKTSSPPLPLMRDFSKTHQSSLNLKGGSTSHLGLLPSGKKRKPPYSVLKPLRYKVGGPSEVYASSRAAFCGMRPHGPKSLSGCLVFAVHLEFLQQGVTARVAIATLFLLFVSINNSRNT